MIPTELIERHAAYRTFARERSAGVPRSDYWRDHSPNFWAELGEAGYRNLGARNYFPVMAERPVDDQFPVAPHDFDAADTVTRTAIFADVTANLPTELVNVPIDGDVITVGSARFRYDTMFHRGLHSLFTMAHHAGGFIGVEGRTLEIGAGAGITAALISAEHGAQVVIVDLPEMLTLSAALLMTAFPDKSFCLPNEVAGGGDAAAADFTLLLPHQAALVKDLSFDLAMNVASFMEMTQEEVDRYFRLIGRVLRTGGIFYVSNRDKLTFLQHYPWDRYARYAPLYNAPCDLLAPLPPMGSGGHIFMDVIRRKVADI